MDWFEAITGFQETDYHSTQSCLSVQNGLLCSQFSNRRAAVGDLQLPSLAELRSSGLLQHKNKCLSVSNISGDIRQIHQKSRFEGALFQVASQFNALEMVSPSVSPQDGVSGYAFDRTQGPACAIAAGAATIYRNYLHPVGGGIGQTGNRQINCLADLALALGSLLKTDADNLLPMKNGYALPSNSSLKRISALLSAMTQSELDDLKGRLRIGLHSDVEVTDVQAEKPFLVSQAFCSALPVAYSRISAQIWEPFARLVLEAAYEATLWAGLINSTRGISNIVLLTRLGGGAFGNRDDWIDEAMEKSLRLFCNSGLEVVFVSFGSIPKSMIDLAEKYGGS
ncbi:hypothetical protein [Ruegeria arenilitoris]|uniref:hypothetical protein n=1 Tax=Ruegeria arenilitoris TaxID=1173585 RepID=UPI00147CAE93|nr:hypothetical protein [Ruegeria arenilitoris]